jgi:hypothetical protein
MSDGRHTHEWVRVEGAEGIRAWGCRDCDETSATCGTCGRASGSVLLLCARCEKEAARVLDDIADALGYYETPPRSLIDSPGDMRLVPGFGETTGMQTPADIEGRMLGWVARWTEYAGPSNAAASDYLRAHHMWAAHHPDESHWLAYLSDMRKLRHEARGVAGLLPKRHPEPCVHCGGQVVQDWADRWWKPLETGLSDVVRCTGCGTTWGDRAHWLFSTRQHIVDVPAMHPDSLITLKQARMVWADVPAGTWRQWLARDRQTWEASVVAAVTWWQARQAHEAGRWEPWAAVGWTVEMLDEAPALMQRTMPERGRRRGEALYRVGDMLALVERWADEERPGRRAQVSA